MRRNRIVSSRARLAGALAALGLLLLSGSAGGAQYKGRCENSVLLWGERWPAYKAKLEDLRALLAQGQLDAGIELQREIVDLQCQNHFQRYYLAELLTQAERLPEAIAVLAELYALGVNDLEKRLDDPKGALAGIRESAAFGTSDLAREIEAKRAEGEARRERFMTKLAALGPGERPPAAYVATGACPFECCQYGRWSVVEDTGLVAAPGSAETVVTARKGTHVEALTGEVHMVPTPVGVVFPEPAYSPQASVPAGAIVFLLDHLGEGISHVWHAGTIHEMSTSGEVQEHCPHPEDECWGEVLEPGAQGRDAAWWVKIQLQDGRVGWTRDLQFGGMSGCD